MVDTVQPILYLVGSCYCPQPGSPNGWCAHVRSSFAYHRRSLYGARRGGCWTVFRDEKNMDETTHQHTHTLSSRWLSVNPSEKYAQVIKLDHFPQNFRGENFKRKCGWNQHLYSFVGFTWSIEYYLPLDPKPWKKQFLKPPSFCLIHLRFSPRKMVGAKFPGGTPDRTWAECHCSLAAIELKVWFKREIYPHGLRVPTVDGRNPAPPGM